VTPTRDERQNCQDFEHGKNKTDELLEACTRARNLKVEMAQDNYKQQLLELGKERVS